MGRIVKGKQLEQKNPFKLHYFPDISVNFPSPREPSETRQETFQRSRFDQPNPESTGDEGVDEETQLLSEKTRERIEQLEEHAYLKGYNEGKEAGTVDGLNHFSQALKESLAYRQTLYHQAEKNAVRLALDVAKKVIQHEVHMRPETVLNVVRAALKEVVARERIKVKVCSRDLAFIKKNAADDIAEGFGFENLRLEADDSISPGGCIIHTSLGDIDARIENQFKTIVEAFDEIAQSRQAAAKTADSE